MAANSVMNVLVNRFKGAGFWRVETEGVIRRAFRDLTNRGFSDEEASEFIDTLWSAALGECVE